MKNVILYYLKILSFAFLISFPLIIPYLKPGFFPTHDGEWAVVRLTDMYREIKDLQFPARFSGYLNFEYGYPLFNFVYPLPYYIGLLFVFLKLGFVNSIKILFVLSIIFSAFSMFVLSASVWKNKWAGIISAIIYIYAPYRIIDLFVRGSIGESLSFVLFPLILLFMKKLYDYPKSYVSIVAVGFLYAFLISTHNVMTILFSIVVFIIALTSLLYKKFNFLVRLIISLVLALGVSAFFWIPTIFEKNLILLSKIPIANRSLNFVQPEQLLIPKWGYGVPIDANGFGYQIGLPQILIFCLVIILILIKKNKDRKIGVFLVLSTLTISFLLFSPSAYVWNHMPLLAEINYPWIILGIIVFLISLVAGYLTKFGKFFIIIAAILAVSAVVLFLPHAKPERFINRGDDFYLTNQATTTSSNELMPLWVKNLPDKKADKKVEILKGNVENLSFNSRKINFSLDLQVEEKVKINTIYYPGWSLYVDGKKTNIDYDNQYGLMTLNIKAGRHLVSGVFSETPVRLISDLISLGSIFTAIVFLLLQFKISKSKTK